ncbi:MAG: hypothetical protein KKB37_10080, partial [Alphaproteobacteria bacterium]|nr:hypothetical protein [Alphaproteobacteria bacterium]
MDWSSGSIGYQIVASMVLAYVVFCFLYGYSSLKSRRVVTAAGARNLQNWSVSGFVNRSRFAMRVSSTVLVPVVVVAVFLSFSGRERKGIVEPHNLFVVSSRNNQMASYIAAKGVIQKNELVASFTSEAESHRLSALKSRRGELIADRETIKLSALPLPSDLMFDLQTSKQRVKTLEVQRTELEQGLFFVGKERVTNKIVWQKARNERLAELPTLEKTLPLHNGELTTATQQFERIEKLLSKGYATLRQMEAAALEKSSAQNRVDRTHDAIARSKQSIRELDLGFEQTDALLSDRITQLQTKAGAVETQLVQANDEFARINGKVAEGRRQANDRRKHQIEAANTRIRKLDDEIAAVLAETQVKSPIGGRVIYRNQTSASLRGTLPLAVVAADH